LKELTEVVQQLKFEVQRDRENEAHEREKLIQQALVRTGWLIPPGTSEAHLVTLYVRKR